MMTAEQTAYKKTTAKKIEILLALSPQYGKKEMVKSFFPKNSPDPENALDSLRKGSKPRLGSPIAKFWDYVAVSQFFLQNTSGAELARANTESFINRLKEEHQPSARDAVSQSGEVTDTNFESFHSSISLSVAGRQCFIEVRLEASEETIESSIRTERVDQKGYYLNPSAASNWSAVVDSKYPLYEYCRSALEALCENNVFTSLVGELKPKAVVMLTGGGAPSKDLVLMRFLLGILRHDVKLDYFLVDISCYMLKQSMRWLCSHAPRALDFERITLTGIWGDALRLCAADKNRFGDQGPTIFTITGGTIGNLSEREFFTSLNCASKPGDLLVLSASTIDSSEDIARSLSKLALPYETREFKEWLKPVVQAVLHHEHSHERVNEALGRVRYDVSSSAARGITNVDETYSVNVTLKMTRTITLFTSARYKEEKLIEFIDKSGWNVLVVQPSPVRGGEHFKMFVFRKRTVE